MGVLKFIAWTLAAVGLGIWLAAGSVSGQTPLAYARAALDGGPVATIQGMSAPVREALEDAHDKVVRDPAAPRERHTAKDRKALDALITKSGGTKSSQR